MTRKVIALIVAVAMLAGGLGMVGCVPEVEELRKLTIHAEAFHEDTMDPTLCSGVSVNALLPLYEFLVGLDLELNIVPAIAKSWEANEDSTVWTFELIEGRKWHDGTPITAHDAKFSMIQIISAYNRTDWRC